MEDGGRCIHLKVLPGKKIGEAGATECGRYVGRYPGMPVIIVNEKGRFMGRSKCAPGLFPNYCCAGRPECIK